MSGGGEEAEVEALLRAAQDAVTLKLQANSHLVSSPSASVSLLDDPAAPDPLDADLARRFDALRSRAPAASASAAAASAGGMDELQARFAALKGGKAAAPEEETRVRLEDLGGGASSEDEVEKVMRWAMDAARLDVATAGAVAVKAKKPDEEEEEDDEKSSAATSDEEEDEEMERKRKETMNKKKPKSKWFFF